ncbi:MAG: transporter substrate-binding domain-containing protein [Gammaproteobacteria bacterium]|nr:transporter substrate-binding domain-containing protein [Gammaproteobacteria bacterium]
MKKISILLLYTLLISPLSLSAKSYTFSGGKNNLIHSIAAEVLIKAYKKADIEITPLYLTLQESLERSNAGETDGELARISTITRFTPNLDKVPVSIISVEAVAFSKNTSLVINNWNDLRGHKITIVKGVKFIETETKGLERNFVATHQDALQLLQLDQTEVIVIPKLASINLIYQNKYHDIKAVSNSLKSPELYHFVHRKNRHLIPIITPILQEMKNSGEIEFIRKAELMKAAKKF